MGDVGMKHWNCLFCNVSYVWLNQREWLEVRPRILMHFELCKKKFLVSSWETWA